MTNYIVRATRWARGWELHVDGVGVTQVRTLDRAEQQARDLIATMTGKPADDDQLTIEVPDLRSYVDRIHDAQAAADRAAADAVAAASDLRSVVHELREGEGLSVSDVAALLGVSRGRVSQLVSR
ncbi:MAG: sigma factor-like helix-turn-helix DNA-binding protein [Microlunatus sp.]